MGHAIGRMRRRQHGGRAQPRALDHVIAEMLVEPGSPHRRHAVAGLQQRPHPFARTAAHQAEVTAVGARQQFDDGGGFAMPPHPQHDAFVGPFHGKSLQDSGWGRSYALNQPTASPVKEKYRPAAVSAQDTTSIALSSCTPLAAITCTNESTDSTRAAVN